MWNAVPYLKNDYQIWLPWPAVNRLNRRNFNALKSAFDIFVILNLIFKITKKVLFKRKFFACNWLWLSIATHAVRHNVARIVLLTPCKDNRQKKTHLFPRFLSKVDSKRFHTKRNCQCSKALEDCSANSESGSSYGIASSIKPQNLNSEVEESF